MAVKVSYPGVYIEEFAPGAPVQSAATNVAAFLGPLAKGPITRAKGPRAYRLPMKVTSLDQFYDRFGSRPAPGFFTWYAVRGFFQNGGTACYVYRVSNAAYAKAELRNAKQTKLADVFALVPGKLGTPITFKVSNPALPLLPAEAKLYAAAATGDLEGSEIKIATVVPADGQPPTDARQFRVGDWVQLLVNNNPLGALARVRSVTAGAVTIEDKHPKTAGVTVKLMYDSTGAVRVTVPDPDKLVVGALGVGTTVKIADPNASAPVVDVIESSSGEQLTKDFKTYRLTLRTGLQNKIDPSAADVTIEAVSFDVAIAQGGSGYQFVNLAPDAASDRYYANAINKYPSLVWVEPKDPPPAVSQADEMRPENGDASVAGGEDEDLSQLADTHFMEALDNLRQVSDVRLVSIPDGYPRTGDAKPKLTAAVHAAAIAHCEQMADRFAVLDPEPGLDLFGPASIETRRNAVDSGRGYAALYYPWVQVPRPGPGPVVTVPPSGHVCGLMARLDDTRGVHKAPGNETLQGTVGVERTMSEAEHGILNLQGINVIRVFREGARPVVYGARTTATDRNWQYVNVRRLFLFLEKSIQDGIRWAVFEPNTTGLWSQLRQTISSFLLTQWQAGALFGAAPANAYYVRIDAALNSFEDQRQGRLNIEIGIRPSYPAEFIIVRIGIWNGGAEVTEA